MIMLKKEIKCILVETPEGDKFHCVLEDLFLFGIHISHHQFLSDLTRDIEDHTHSNIPTPIGFSLKTFKEKDNAKD